MRLDFLERLAFRLRQEERGGDEIDDRASGKGEEHRGVAVFADRGKEERGDGRGDGLIDEQRHAHAIGTDARGHQFGEREPDANAGAGGEESHETENANGGQRRTIQQPSIYCLSC